MSTTYDFMEKYLNFSLFIILIPTPDFPQFHYMLGGNLGSLLYGDVSVIYPKFSIDDNAIDKSSDLPYIQHENQSLWLPSCESILILKSQSYNTLHF